MNPMRFLSALFVCSLVAVPAFAGGNDPSGERVATAKEKGGTNVKGQSGDFKDYLNDGEEEEKESNSVELADLGNDAKVAVGGDDHPSLGVKVGY